MRKMLARWDAAAATPENERRLASEVWRWWRRHPLMLMSLTVIVALISAQIAYDAWLLYGWRPAVVVEGQIVDYDTKQPVEGAWVLIYIWADGKMFDANGNLRWYAPEGSSSGMISPMSSVVQTDKEGRFHYRVSAYDAFQSAGYTRYGIWMGAYKEGYESVGSHSGKSQQGGENYLPFMDPASDEDWPSLKRIADTLEGRRLSRDDFPAGLYVAPSNVTWPQWAKFLHALARDEVTHWCNAPSSSQESLLYASYYAAVAQITDQERQLQTRFIAINGPDSPTITRAFALPRLRALDESRRVSAPNYSWPEPYDIEPLASREHQSLPPAPAFTVEQRDAVCLVMHQQVENILLESLSFGNSK